MVVFLPNDPGGLPALEQSLTASNTQQWLRQLGPVPKVIVTMPKFKTTQQFELGRHACRDGDAAGIYGQRGFFRNDRQARFLYFGGDP